MKKHPLLISLFMVFCSTCLSQMISVNNQTFKIDTLYPLFDIPSHNKGLSFPWEITYGPDDSLWVTEAHGYRIWKIHPGNKGNRVLADLNNLKNFDYFKMPNSYPAPQGGLMGLAIHPQFLSGSPYIYVALVYYVYPSTGSPNNSNCAGSGSATARPCYFKTKILRYTYDLATNSLNNNPDIVLDNLSGSNDHNSGRLKISPFLESDGNYHLYYTIGDQGAGQFNNAFRINNAQDPDIYEGKILRLNTAPDADAVNPSDPFNSWIPNDNPFKNSITGFRTAVFSFGHRNSQGLVWANVLGSWILYNSEHGDKSDDEVNILKEGRNYGWPKVAGLCDNNYEDTSGTPSLHNHYLASQKVGREDTFCVSKNVVEPIFSFFNWGGNAIPDSTSNNYTWPTIAPSSIDYYGSMYIPGWENSLLVTSLKYGFYRLKLSSAGDKVDSSSTPNLADTIPYLHGYRIRDLAIAPSGDTIFLAIDSNGSTSGPTGGFNGSQSPTKTPGFILRMIYMETLPLLENEPPSKPVNNRASTIVYPNPASKYLNVVCQRGLRKPLSILLYDLSGRILLRQTSDRDSFTVDVGNMKTGMYIFKLFSGYGTNITTEKIIIR